MPTPGRDRELVADVIAGRAATQLCAEGPCAASRACHVLCRRRQWKPWRTGRASVRRTQRRQQREGHHLCARQCETSGHNLTGTLSRDWASPSTDLPLTSSHGVPACAGTRAAVCTAQGTSGLSFGARSSRCGWRGARQRQDRAKRNRVPNSLGFRHTFFAFSTLTLCADSGEATQASTSLVRAAVHPS